MKKEELKSNVMLLLTAAIWGFAFVAQRVGIEYLGTFTFNGVRFALGAVSLVPIILFFNRKASKQGKKITRILSRNTIFSGFIMGIVLFCRKASLQQIGLYYTTVGRAAL